MKKKIITAIVLALLFSCKDDKKAEIKSETVITTSKAKPELADPGIAEYYDTHHETIGGWLKIGVDASRVIENFGNDYNAAEGEISQVNGMYWQEWDYPDNGVTLLMESENAESQKSVIQITLYKPSRLQTSRGIAIGSSAGDVRKAYADVINNKESSGQSIVAGSIYSGVIFTIADNAVSEIFIGAAVE
ncbi:hypothetical protein OGH69_09810 [Flavobacterium sp. MFBS3-15]|uniref:hypothetical protein n=1 Tax=Flavobacterium sp. MFBS3-15 TaxID=2989816 RepID=UPI002235C2B1|nr:hypothetical protein [Flavobacterium sp. MFBS3-15]MCW4469261.1 hypothetical protein [Flavobacterium sp. MFBS3-15]